MAKLLIGAVLTLPGGLPDLHIASPELTIPENVGSEVIAAIELAGGSDGKLDFKENVDVPVRFNLFGLHLDRSIPLDADCYLQVEATPRSEQKAAS